MSLSTGRGPLSAHPAGRFSAVVPAGVSYLEPHRRRVRATKDGRTVIDTERALLVHRPGRPPEYAFVAADVHDLPTEAQPDAEGYVRVEWDEADSWFEEDEQVLGHPRNPYHRVDCLRSGRRLRVEVADTVLVDTTDTLVVYETALEPRLYVAPEHVRTDLLVESATTTYCSYKGAATYWTAHIGEAALEDVAWSYEHALPESLPLQHHLSFDDTRVRVVCDLPPGD